MKIEILEQAFASYLRNCEGCLISQTNWRVTPKMMNDLSDASLQKAQGIVDDVKNQININILKKSKIRQFISQCEIDIVGIKSDKKNSAIYLFDTAFHEKGLHYKDTPTSVIMKLVRAFIIGILFFDGYEIHVGFVSPKCDPAPLKKINSYLPNVCQILGKYSSTISVETYLNDMCSELIVELASLVKDINDDGDLFIRAVKLLNLSQSARTLQTFVRPTTSNNQNKQDNKTVIYTIFDGLLQNNKLTPSVISNLCDKDFSKNIFKLSGYPFMIEINNIPSKDQKRYYVKCFLINGKIYRICGQWYDNRIAAFENWAKNL